MKKQRLVFVSNALDDSTRARRGISSDSPAASRKVLGLCGALRKAGVNACVLSIGRGRAEGSWSFHAATVRRVDGVPVIYAPFTHARFLSELVSLLAPAGMLRRVRGTSRGESVALFYNRAFLYVPTLLAARVLGFRMLLDLEDGEDRDTLPAKARAFLLRRVYDWTCGDQALLACGALATATAARRLLCYYGTRGVAGPSRRWVSDTVTVLLGGSLAEKQGTPILAEAIRHLRSDPTLASRQLRLAVTGHGPALEDFAELARPPEAPAVLIHGRLSGADYQGLLANCEVGLSLKPRSGHLADTTFPSKVVEMASAGLLVVTTDISDVRKVLEDGALYLEKETGEELANLLTWIVEHRYEAQAVARRGQQIVEQKCSPTAAGQAVARFIFGEGQ